MKTFENFKQEQMQDKEFKQAYDEIQFIANNRAIEELEKISEQIDKCITSSKKSDINVKYKKGLIIGMSGCLDIINERLAILKGANNETDN